MTNESIKEKIESGKANIEKLEKALVNAEKAIAKAETVLSGFAEIPDMRTPAGWDYSDAKSKISEKTETVKKTIAKIAKARETLAALETKLTETEIRNAILKSELPADFEILKQNLITEWIKFDTERREKFRNDEKSMTRPEMRKKYGWDTTSYRISDSEIRENNEKAATDLVVGMFFRIREITGTVKRFENIHIAGPSLNGIAIGEKGTAIIETIVAGGYNIQRLHVRVLVKKYNHK